MYATEFPPQQLDFAASDTGIVVTEDSLVDGEDDENRA